MKDIRGVIFDLDGVIVSTDSFHFKAWKKIADEENIFFDEAINNRLRGVSRMESLDILLEKTDSLYSEMEKIELASKKNSYYVEYISGLDKTNILDNVLDVLETLKQRGIKIAIGSSSKNTLFILNKIGLNGYFDAVADGNMIKNSKPDPEVFLLASQLLKTPAKYCAVVEDAISGIDAANSANMVSFGIGDAQSYQKCAFGLESIKDLVTALFHD